MATTKMHADEVDSDVGLVRRLLAAQFLECGDLPVRHFSSSGTDNAMYRLGDDLAVRLPRIPRVVAQADKEWRWVPVLAPHLPFEVPVPVARGVPGEGFPLPWTVCRWVHGETPTEPHDPHGLARDLAAFVRALQAVDATDGPPPGDHNFGRGRPLADRDEMFQQSLAALGDLVDAGRVQAMWQEALAAPTWDAPGVWVHGDLSPGNVLVRDGRLAGVIDFGGLGVGDPAVELIVAWNLLPRDARDEYRAALGVDDATWLRGIGWALSVAVNAMPYYLRTNPPIVAESRYVLGQLLTDGA